MQRTPHQSSAVRLNEQAPILSLLRSTKKSFKCSRSKRLYRENSAWYQAK